MSTDLILRRRRQLVVHSYLYYRLAETLWSDAQFDAAAMELVALQRQHGTQHGYHDAVFADWDGSTGFHLLTVDPLITHERACRLLRHHHHIDAERDSANPPASSAAVDTQQLALL